MRCSDLRNTSGLSSAASSKAGQTRFERLSSGPSESILFWDYFRNAYATRNAGFAHRPLTSSIPSSPSVCEAQELTDTCGAGEKSSDHAPTWIELAGLALASNIERLAPKCNGRSVHWDFPGVRDKNPADSNRGNLHKLHRCRARSRRLCLRTHRPPLLRLERIRNTTWNGKTIRPPERERPTC